MKINWYYIIYYIFIDDIYIYIYSIQLITNIVDNYNIYDLLLRRSRGRK